MTFALKIKEKDCAARNRVKYHEMADFSFLSPVRLPFRHTGGNPPNEFLKTTLLTQAGDFARINLSPFPVGVHVLDG